MNADGESPAQDGPLVSIVIPTYNRMATLPATIESVRAQTYANIELVIVDDRSSDGTREFLNGLDLPFPVVVLFHEARQGGAVARNTGIAAASGEYVAFLDSDDVWHGEKLARQMRRLKALGPGYEACFCGWASVNSSGQPFYVRSSSLEGDVHAALVRENFIGTTSAFLASRARILEVGGFDPALKACQDWDLYLKLAKVTRFANVRDCLLDYLDDRSERISTNPRSRMRGHLRVYAKHRRAFLRGDRREAAAFRLYIADCLMHLGRTKLARNLMLGAFRRDPLSPTVLLRMGVVWTRRAPSDYANALKTLQAYRRRTERVTRRLPAFGGR
ncbi:glycosyltransferase family 2 protein [Aureimonas populi]|uniref:Glycosyltransferase family 2 protein n=1 Tax=Aureimonas populi TaxID=1701758 RepID=A0ABW5CJP2_9HYPH|nr:glycosyltransferase family A protein [Aureimonas populi]